MSFGDLLRRHRLAARLTQEALAERAGLSVRAITDLERGVRRAPYRDTVRMLAGALGLDGEARIALEEAARRPRERVAASGPYARPHAALRAPLTPLLGREREVAETVAMLRRDDVRLLTLTGTGGIGKTRVAIAVAETLRDDFADGVTFVALAPLSDPDLLLPTIAHALQVADAPGEAWLDRLSDVLRDGHRLFILDNFEHLLMAAPQIARLLESCTRLTILTTSRAALRLSGERAYPVPPLALPIGRSLAGDLRRFAAVDLFCRRAEAVSPDFALTDRNTAAVSEIVRRLDGLPLAIELAATRSGMFAPDALLARLTGTTQRASLGLLTTGARDLPARQRTLRDAIAWSHDLLSPAEQRLFRRLAVFAGGWTVDAAETVCDEDGDLGVDALDGLTSLLDHNLITRARAPEGEPRFAMFETIREFAWERLIASGEVESTRGRHARSVLALAEEAEPLLHSNDEEAATERIDADFDNLRAALTWCGEKRDTDTGLRLMGTLLWYWERGEHVSEGRRRAETMLAIADPAVRSSARARALWTAGALAATQGDFIVARSRLMESVAISRELGDTPTLAGALVNLGFVWRNDLDTRAYLPEAQAMIEESVALFERLGDRWGLVHALNSLGSVARQRGDHETSRARFEQALALARETGHLPLVSWCLNELGIWAVRERDYVAARDLFEESLRLLREARPGQSTADASVSLAVLLLRAGEEQRALALLTDALRQYWRMGVRGGVAGALEIMGGAAFGQKEPERAARLFGAADAIREASRIPLPSVHQGLRRATLTAIQATLGEPAYAAARDAGRALSLDDAVREALAVADDTGSEEPT